MKMKVIFIPYCNLATMGLSLLCGCKWVFGEGEGAAVHESEEFSADGEWERDDEGAKDCHLGDEKHKYLL